MTVRIKLDISDDDHALIKRAAGQWQTVEAFIVMAAVGRARIALSSVHSAGKTKPRRVSKIVKRYARETV